MSDFQNNLINSFSKTINNGRNIKKERRFGTIVEELGKKYVIIDGSDIKTPINEAIGAEHGDRVIVEVINHNVTVLGNYTEPPSARYATAYIKESGKSMIIGDMGSDGKPIGKYLILNNDAVYLADTKIDENGKKEGVIIASFEADKITIGDTKADIELCNGYGNMRYSNGTLLIEGEKAIKIQTMNTNDNIEVLCNTHDGKSEVGFKVYNSSDTDKFSSVLLSYEGLDIKTPNDKPIKINGKEVLDDKTVIVFGSFSTSGKVSTPNIIKTFEIPDIPENYILTGLVSLYCSSSDCVLSGYSIKQKNITLYLKFLSIPSTDVGITVEWFAMRSKNAKTLSNQTLQWD